MAEYYPPLFSRTNIVTRRTAEDYKEKYTVLDERLKNDYAGYLERCENCLESMQKHFLSDRVTKLVFDFGLRVLDPRTRFLRASVMARNSETDRDPSYKKRFSTDGRAYGGIRARHLLGSSAPLLRSRSPRSPRRSRGPQTFERRSDGCYTRQYWKLELLEGEIIPMEKMTVSAR